MTFPLAITPPISGVFAFREYPGFGILGADISTTGDNGGSPVLNDNISPTGEYYWRIVTPPSGGALTIYPDMTFVWDSAGLPEGSYPWSYSLGETGVVQGTATVWQTVGSVASIVAGSNSAQGNIASPIAIKQTHLVFAASSNQANSAIGVGVSQASTTFVSPANSIQVNQATASAVRQTHLLSVSESEQPNMTASGSISQTSIVMPASSLQHNYCSSSSISLSGTSYVAGSNSYISNMASAIAVSQTHMVGASRAVIGNVTGPVAIAQTNMISAAPSVQKNTVSGCSVWSSTGGSQDISAIVEALFSGSVEQGVDLRSALRLILAFAAGNAAGLDGTSPVFRDIANTKDRIVANMNKGTRTIISRDAS